MALDFLLADAHELRDRGVAAALGLHGHHFELALVLASDRVVAALSVGRPEDLLTAHRLIAARAPLGAGRAIIVDPDADLAEI